MLCMCMYRYVMHACMLLEHRQKVDLSQFVATLRLSHLGFVFLFVISWHCTQLFRSCQPAPVTSSAVSDSRATFLSFGRAIAFSFSFHKVRARPCARVCV